MFETSPAFYKCFDTLAAKRQHACRIEVLSVTDACVDSAVYGVISILHVPQLILGKNITVGVSAKCGAKEKMVPKDNGAI